MNPQRSKLPGIRTPTHYFQNEPADDIESSGLVEEYPIRGAVEPRDKLPRGTKAVTTEVTPPQAMPRIKILASHYSIHSPSLIRTVKMMEKRSLDPRM